MKLFSIHDTEIRISPLLLAVIPAAIVMGEGRMLIIAALSLTVHEAAHAIMAARLGYPVRSVEIQPFGFVAKLDCGCAAATDAAAIYAAGPVASLSMAAFSALLESLIQLYKNAALGMTEFNLIIAAVNLLPALPLDGGRLVYTIFSERNRKTALTVLKLSGVLTGCSFIGLFVYLLTKNALNPTFPIMGVFLMIAALAERYEPPVRRRLPKRSVLPVRETAVRESVSLTDALNSLPKGSYAVLNVLDGSDRRTAQLDEKQLLDAVQMLGLNAKLSDAVELYAKLSYNKEKNMEQRIDAL